VKTTSAAEGTPDLARMLWPMTTLSRRPEPAPAEPPKRAGIDVGAVITRALTAAGLMK
jgi:feruloyl esterase